MQKSFGFQQKYYGDHGGMHMETQDEEYAFHEQSWSSDHNHHKQDFPGMHMKPHGAFSNMEAELFSMSKHNGLHGKLGGGVGNHGMFHDGMHGNHGYGHGQGYGHGHGHGYGHDNHAHGFGKKFQFGGTNNNNSHHQFSKYNSGGHQDYYSEETEYEAHSEEHHGHNMSSKADEMRYEHQFSGGNVGYANPYGGGRINNHMNMNHRNKPHGGGYNSHKPMWTAKGV